MCYSIRIRTLTAGPRKWIGILFEHNTNHVGTRRAWNKYRVWLSFSIKRKGKGTKQSLSKPKKIERIQICLLHVITRQTQHTDFSHIYLLSTWFFLFQCNLWSKWLVLLGPNNILDIFLTTFEIFLMWFKKKRKRIQAVRVVRTTSVGCLKRACQNIYALTWRTPIFSEITHPIAFHFYHASS